ADLPHAPIDVSDCVSENLGSLSACAFEVAEAKNQDPFDVPAARRVPGVELVDITPILCPEGVCRAVIGDAITYRGSNHMTATFAASLDPFIREELPEVD
ncbi:MAG: hypothetical protein M3Y34_07735, partial [Actinomycetota bacterium]|nr:hypothetical protein [Actinomycetota bacterium]